MAMHLTAASTTDLQRREVPEDLDDAQDAEEVQQPDAFRALLRRDAQGRQQRLRPDRQDDHHPVEDVEAALFEPGGSVRCYCKWLLHPARG